MWSIFKKRMTPGELAINLYMATTWQEAQDGEILRVIGKEGDYDLGAVPKQVRLLRIYSIDLYIRDNQMSSKPKEVLLKEFLSCFDVDLDEACPLTRAEVDSALEKYRAVEQDQSPVGRRFGEIFAEGCGYPDDEALQDYGIALFIHTSKGIMTLDSKVMVRMER